LQEVITVVQIMQEVRAIVQILQEVSIVVQLSVERNRLVIERDALRETNEEMKILQEVRA
jgi:hypothetical protein